MAITSQTRGPLSLGWRGLVGNNSTSVKCLKVKRSHSLEYRKKLRDVAVRSQTVPWWECLHEGLDQNSALLLKLPNQTPCGSFQGFGYIGPQRLCPRDLSATYDYLQSLSNGWL